MNHTVSYSPEDNKIRLYVGRVPRDEYEALRAAGFVSTPKQDCDFAGVWTPEREDLAAQYLEEGEEIGDEDYSPLERAADRAERFEGYREKREGEAVVGADKFEAGPQAFGHQSRARAERQAKRHDRVRGWAVGQWAKAEYWQERTAGVIAHALYRSDARVRRGRVLTLETELRRMGERTDERGLRWKAHYELRLGYERAMLANEGGCASEADMEPGGWINGVRTRTWLSDVPGGWIQIQGVNKSPVMGRVVSVKVWGVTQSMVKERSGKRVLVSVNVERLGEGAYRAPTVEEKAAFLSAQAERKAAEKIGKPKEAALVNPTEADADKLQTIWNERAREAHVKRGAYGEYVAATVWKMTQKEYSLRSKGEYSACATSDVSEKLDVRNVFRAKGGQVTVFKVRTGSLGGWSDGRRVVVLTDKPQKGLPWDEVERVQEEQPTADGMFWRLEEVAAAMAKAWNDEEEGKLLADAQYVGWVGISSQTQKQWTDEGMKALKKFEEVKAEGGEPVEHGTIYSGVMA